MASQVQAFPMQGLSSPGKRIFKSTRGSVYGTILAAGTIVRTEGAPASGNGRSAAAKALAGKGFGIKIPSGGYIEIFDGENSPVYFS